MSVLVAKRYAKALLDLGIERGEVDAFQTHLNLFSELVEASPELRTVITNPSIGFSERRAVMSEIAKRLDCSQLIRNFIFLLLDKNRLGLIDYIADAFNKAVDVHLGNLRAKIHSAEPLDDDEVDAIRRAIVRMTGKTVFLETYTDPGLVGGVVTTIGSVVYDGSVRTQLETLRNQVLTEA
jgi:F-type H+-transporting ATPase subunit delta